VFAFLGGSRKSEELLRKLRKRGGNVLYARGPDVFKSIFLLGKAGDRSLVRKEPEYSQKKKRSMSEKTNIEEEPKKRISRRPLRLGV